MTATQLSPRRSPSVSLPATVTAEPARRPIDVDAAPGATIRERFIPFMGLVLLGYALDGRGFAYIGVPPLFIGEITLAFGLVALATARGWQRVLGSTLAWPLLALCAWGAFRTLPYLSEYGIAAARDAVVWGYAAFAIIVATLVFDRPTVLARMARHYGRFVKAFLIGIPIVFVTYRFLGTALPKWPWADVTVVQLKEGDVLVHLAGVLAFWVSELGGATTWPWVLLLTFSAGAMGVIDRAGMVAFLAVFGLCVLLKPRHTVAWRAAVAIVLTLLGLWVTDLSVPVPGGKGREVSFRQFVVNFGSVASDTGSDGLDSTKEWRLDWWKEIVNYTVRGEYFWTGKGFGINLADDDGFQVMADNSLRTPHNVHMTMLARGGVPMALLWAAVQLTWAVGMLGGFLRSRAANHRRWEGLFFFLLAYWAAFLINGSFDVFLEGPMGGTWFWCIYGAGLGAMLVRARSPDALGDISSRPPVTDRGRATAGTPAVVYE